MEPVRHLTFVAELPNSLWLEGTHWRRRMSPIHLHLLLNHVPATGSALGVLPGSSEAVTGRHRDVARIAVVVMGLCV